MAIFAPISRRLRLMRGCGGRRRGRSRDRHGLRISVLLGHVDSRRGYYAPRRKRRDNGPPASDFPL